MDEEDFSRGNGDPDVFGYPGEKRYIGDKPVTQTHKDYSGMTRGFNYPFDEDIDYDPRIDEEQDDE